MNLEVHYSVHKNLSPILTLSHMNSVNINTFYFVNFHFNIILPSMPRYYKYFLPFILPYKICVCMSLLYNICYIIWSSSQYITRSINYGIPHRSVFTILPLPLPSEAEIFSSVHRFPPNVTDKVAFSNRSTGKIAELYISSNICDLDSRQDEKKFNQNGNKLSPSTTWYYFLMNAVLSFSCRSQIIGLSSF
jgi:hypothetical protein